MSSAREEKAFDGLATTSFRPPWLQFPYYNHAKRYTLINVSSSLRRFFFSRKQVVCTLDVHMVRKRALKTP